MTTYLLEASLSLLVTFGFYKMALESQQMHGFKRFYLLGSLLFAALVPLVSFELEPTAALVDYQPARVLQMETPAAFQQPELQPELEPVAVGFDYVACCTTYGFWLYGLVTTVLVGRFVVNLSRLMRQITTNPQQPFRGATLVLLATNTLPYTFLQYLFVSEAAYRRKEIEEEVFTHELTHIQQRHSLDVLLLEVLLCLAWFNPLLYGVRRAMQLNHEFLADEAVNERHRNVPRYQQLMLSKLTSGLRVSLTSAFTFQTTKKRFLMMTKSTSRIRAWLLGASATLLLGALVFLFGTDTESATLSASKNSKVYERQVFASEAEKVIQLHGDMWVKPVSGKEPSRKYSELSTEEKQWVIVRRPNYFIPLRVPTQAQWAAWKNSEKYSASVHSRRHPEGVRLKENELNNYQRLDMGFFHVSYDFKQLGSGVDSTRRLIVLWTKERRAEILNEPHPDTLPQLFLSKQALVKAQHQQPETEAERTARLYDERIARPGLNKKKYAELSAEEKKWVRVGKNKPLLRRTPTAAQWEEWQNPRKFCVWAEGKWMRGPALNTYQRTDIASYLVSNITKELRQRAGYIYQIHLTTKQEYERYLKTPSDPYYVVVMKPQTQRPLPKIEAPKEERPRGNMPVLGWKQRTYSALSGEEKKRVTIFETPLLPRRTHTEAQWAAWQNPQKFGIWVDGKRLQGQTLSAAYLRTDIVSFMGSYVHKNARQPEGYLYQLDLTTNQGYKAEQHRINDSPYYGLMMEDQPKSRKPRS